MKHMIVGAGATLAQALDLGVSRESCPPLIRDFARKTWWNYTPYPFLEPYLLSLGHGNFGNDAREAFYELEARGEVTIEGFLEFAWHNRRNESLFGGTKVPGTINS